MSALSDALMVLAILAVPIALLAALAQTIGLFEPWSESIDAIMSREQRKTEARAARKAAIEEVLPHVFTLAGLPDAVEDQIRQVQGSLDIILDRREDGTVEVQFFSGIETRSPRRLPSFEATAGSVLADALSNAMGENAFCSYGEVAYHGRPRSATLAAGERMAALDRLPRIGAVLGADIARRLAA